MSHLHHSQPHEHAHRHLNHGPAEPGSPRFHRTNRALFIAGFASFALLYCVQPLLPVFSRAFGHNAAGSSLILSIATFSLAIGLLITGPLSDAIGRRPVMFAGLGIASLATLLCPFMPDWHSLLAMRLLTGLALSGVAAVAMTYLSEEVAEQHLGRAMGLYISGNALGGMSGRVLGGVLGDWLPWQDVLLLIGSLGLLATLAFIQLLPHSHQFRPTPLSLRNLWSGLQLHWRDPGLPWLFLIAFLLMGGFVTLFNYIGYRLLAEPYGLSQSMLGLLALVYLAGTVSSTEAGLLADRHGRRKVFWPMACVMLTGVLLTLCEPLLLVLAGMLLFTFGFFASHSLASSWVGRRAHVARGQAASLYLFSYYLGSSLAGTAGGLFWQQGGWDGVVLFIGVLVAAAILIGLHLIRIPPAFATQSATQPQAQPCTG